MKVDIQNQNIEISHSTANEVGNRMKLKNMPVGTLIYNIELTPGKGGKLIKNNKLAILGLT